MSLSLLLMSLSLLLMSLSLLLMSLSIVVVDRYCIPSAKSISNLYVYRPLLTISDISSADRASLSRILVIVTDVTNPINRTSRALIRGSFLVTREIDYIKLSLY
jgi:hypothetical protein